MSDQDQSYHRRRTLECREMAERAGDPDVRRRHEELAELHAARLRRPIADVPIMAEQPIA